MGEQHEHSIGCMGASFLCWIGALTAVLLATNRMAVSKAFQWHRKSVKVSIGAAKI
jgi:hypothetical protein